MVNRDLESQSDNIWIKRAASWVYNAYIKENAKPENYETFMQYIQKLKDLDLPEDDTMVFDNTAWQIGSMVYALQKEEQPDFRKFDAIFDTIRAFHFMVPSEGYSFIFKSFIKLSEEWQRFLDFADWWNLENFRQEDYLKVELKGHMMPSLAERAYMSYAKKLLEGEPVDQSGLNRSIDRERINAFLPKLDRLIERHPDFLYPPFYKAKLLLLMGDKEDALSAFIPFARQKKNEFWVWEQMAEIFHDDDELKMACYCKAFSLRTQEDFLVKLRQAFAAFLIEKRLYDEAKTEIEIVVDTRQKKKWGIPRQISQWKEESWYQSAVAKRNNNDLYRMHKSKAEAILFRDIPEVVVVVEFVNADKKMVNFVKDRQTSGFFNFSGLINKPAVGDILKVRFNGELQNGFNTALTVKKCQDDVKTEVLKSFEGNLEQRPDNKFGFCDNVFIDAGILKNLNLTNGEHIKGTAMISFNKKKNEWGWKAIRIESRKIRTHGPTQTVAASSSFIDHPTSRISAS